MGLSILFRLKKKTSDKKKNLIKKMPLVKKTDGSAGASLQVQLRPMTGSQTSLSVNYRERLGHPGASSL
jgi:hypothetical protein